MKKILLFVVLSVLLPVYSVFAQDLGVQIIEQQITDLQSVSLDDIQLESTIEIPDFGDITPFRYTVSDCIMVRKPGQLGDIWTYRYEGSYKPDGYDKYYDFRLKVDCELHGDPDYPYWSNDFVNHYFSRSEADFVFLTMDIVNTTAGKKNYLKESSVKVVFDDRIEYGGWFYQRDFDLNKITWIDSQNNFAIEPYYTGHYVFGCTLPNAVFESKMPLRMEITLGDVEMTYHIRK